VKRIQEAQDPVILVDRNVERFGLTDEVTKLAESTGLKVFAGASSSPLNGTHDLHSLR